MNTKGKVIRNSFAVFVLSLFVGACSGSNVVDGDASDGGSVFVGAGFCDDGNPCTTDNNLGDEGCEFVPVLDGTNCDDGDACTINDACVAGTCVGTENNCDDGDECTVGTCDSDTGCSYTLIEKCPCDDGNACTEGEYFDKNGDCVGGVSTNCDDGNPCTEDHCATDVGCTFPAVLLGSPCNDGNTCTEQDHCNADLECVGVDIDCDDDNVCTIEVGCDPEDGGCLYENVDVTCDDGSDCTEDDFCNAGSCIAGEPVHDPQLGILGCSDGNPCTDDFCIPKGGCSWSTNEAYCEDGDACTADDQCQSAQCVGDTYSCDDGNDCTSDGCDEATGCTHTALAEGTPCDDGSICTIIELCDEVGNCNVIESLVCDDNNPCTDDWCEAELGCLTPETDCDDGNQCTADSCNPASGCIHTILNDQPCDTGDDCIWNEECNAAGECDGVDFTWFCDDGKVCTTDVCLNEDGKGAPDSCTWLPAPGEVCEADDDICTFEVCGALEECILDSAQPINCDDGNPCTADSCNGSIGCVNVGMNCDDGDACTNDFCDSEVEGCYTLPVDCDDGDVCTADSCDVDVGCQNDVINCDDGDACTNDSCDAAVGCEYSLVDCDDGEQCFSYDCVPAVGCTQSVNFNAECDDFDNCTWNEKCDAFGVCTPSQELPCEDENPCTEQFCDTDPVSGDPFGCSFIFTEDMPCEADGDACTVELCGKDASCLPETAQVVNCNDGNTCTNDSCDSDLGCLHVPIVCDDGDACTFDSCQNGFGCAFATINCTDGNACTEDSCHPDTGCFSQPEDDCNDDDLCTNDSCDPQKGCQYAPLDCDDNSVCTVDSCDPVIGCSYQAVPGCEVPCSLLDCDDGDACTNDSCDDDLNTCAYDDLSCDDGDACTVDSCDPAVGCTYAPLDCDDGDDCTVDECDNATGCSSDPLNCDDDSPCTIDFCDPDSDTGCSYEFLEKGLVCSDCSPGDVSACPTFSTSEHTFVGTCESSGNSGGSCVYDVGLTGGTGFVTQDVDFGSIKISYGVDWLPVLVEIDTDPSGDVSDWLPGIVIEELVCEGIGDLAGAQLDCDGVNVWLIDINGIVTAGVDTPGDPKAITFPAE